MDALTGAQYTLRPENVNVQLRPIPSSSTVAAIIGRESSVIVLLEELDKLENMKNEGEITEEAYQKLRASLLDKYK